MKELINNDIETDNLYGNISRLLHEARSSAMRVVNTTMVQAYWNVGRMIVEAQGGEVKSEYGSDLINKISTRLTQEFGKGYTSDNLRRMRQFYLTYQNCGTLSHKLSWSHYQWLMRVDNDKARQFYEIEAEKGNWSVRQLKRQITTFFYERLLASHGNNDVANEIYKNEPETFNAENLIRDPYILEFAGIEPSSKFYESDLENALITHLQEFLLELGRGFSFVARQKHINFDGRHFYIDLVFYNYITKNFVLIDLKLGDLTQQDIGQMQMYVNYYQRELMTEGDNPPIGIVLCADKSDAIVRYTLPEDNNQIFASKYKLYLPSEEELRREIAASYNSFRLE